MIAVDMLDVPRAGHNNIYLLVGHSLHDQTASRITTEIVHHITVYGIPDIQHSDQGTNFESTIFQQTLETFGINKRHTTAYHPQCDGMVKRVNRSLLQLLRDMRKNTTNGNVIYNWCLCLSYSSAHINGSFTILHS